MIRSIIIATALFLFCAHFLAAQQILLQGQVAIHNSKYRTDTIQYVADAFVSAPYTTPVDTDVQGHFELRFAGIDAGTGVKLQVEKADLEVVNQRDLEHVIINRNTPLKVFMAEKGWTAAAQTELYDISLEALTNRYQEFSEHFFVKNAIKFLAKFYNKRGLQRQNAGSYQGAIEDYQRLLELSPQNATALNLMGVCYYYSKDYKNAVAYYEKAYEFDDSNTSIFLNNMGMAYSKMGKLNKAAALLEELQQLIPDDGLVYRDWSLYYSIIGNVEAALSNLEKAIKLGYRNLHWIETEESLETLRSNDRYKAIVAKLKTKE
jgi:tetratricopeptide (TPR) repeat protein